MPGMSSGLYDFNPLVAAFGSALLRRAGRTAGPRGDPRDPRATARPGLLWVGWDVFLALMAGRQAQPSLGFWRGVSYGHPAPLAATIHSISWTPQPRFLSSRVSALAAFDEAHGFAVNLVVVTTLTASGAAFLSGRPRRPDSPCCARPTGY
jgi:hypothetical protein